jgi:hypothetical protein
MQPHAGRATFLKFSAGGDASMANPLYSRSNVPNTPDKPALVPDPAIATKAEEPAGPRMYVATDKSFSVAVPPGWTASGSTKTLPPSLRYAALEIKGPDNSLLFVGHTDLPQLYFVPGHWHGYLAPGQRVTIGGSARYPAPLLSAPQAAAHLAAQRFAAIVGVTAEPAAALLEETHRGMARSGMTVPYLDACRFYFSSADQSWTGMLQLAVFGGGNPGDTWQIDFVSGYWTPQGRKQIAWEYWQAMHLSFSTDTTWAQSNPDQVPQNIRDAFLKGMSAADQLDRDRVIAANKAIGDIKQSQLNTIMSRKHGGG